MGKIYIVLQGHTPGIYNNWNDCKAEVDGFKNASYKSFKNEAAIKKDTNKSFSDFYFKDNKTENTSTAETTNINTNELNENSIYVDGACSGNPGKGEYQIVYYDKKVIFRSNIYNYTTNNLMEFFALVDALEFNLKNDNKYFIYSDSVTAMAWVRNKKCNSKVKVNNNQDSIDKIKECEFKLKNNLDLDFGKVLKWDTRKLGEIPADFGRK